MVSCTLLARNVFAALRPRTTDAQVFAITRWMVFPITLLALLLAVVAHSLIVVVLLVAYDFIAQLLPAVLIGGLFWRRATAAGVLAGLLVAGCRQACCTWPGSSRFGAWRPASSA